LAFHNYVDKKREEEVGTINCPLEGGGEGSKLGKIWSK
jgi:hypothetical protein